VGLITRVASAKKGTKSLKTTIPEGIAEFLELSDKDEIEWKMEVQKQDRLATVQKKKMDKDDSRLARLTMKEKLDQKVSFR
jgi:hypothetical protein